METYRIISEYQDGKRKFVNIECKLCGGIFQRRKDYTQEYGFKHCLPRESILTEQQWLEAHQKYINEKLTLDDIASYYSIGRETVRFNFEKRNFYIRKSNELTEWKPDNPLVIIERYKNGESATSLTKEFNAPLAAMYRFLRKNNVKIRDYSESQQKLKCNREYFDKIDSEDKAYWLGFIAADGGVHKNSLIIGLAARDINHVKKFKAHIQSEHKIREYINSDKPRCQIAITSKYIVKSLSGRGIKERKSLTIEEVVVPYEYLRHFFRGYFDGDGTICHFKKDSTKWRFSVLGTEIFLEWMRQWLMSQLLLPISGVQKPFDRKIHVLQCANQETVRKIFHLLYKDSTIYLDRKYEKYIQMCSEIHQSHKSETAAHFT